MSTFSTAKKLRQLRFCEKRNIACQDERRSARLIPNVTIVFTDTWIISPDLSWGATKRLREPTQHVQTTSMAYRPSQEYAFGEERTGSDGKLIVFAPIEGAKLPAALEKAYNDAH